MNLYLDVGNSRIKWKDDEMSAASVALDLDQLAGQWQEYGGSGVVSLSGCCVRGEQLTRRVDLLAQARFGQTVCWKASVDRACGLSNAYAEPEKLGVDRWVAMVAARARFPDQPCIVVDAGTAVTIDLVDAGGVHRGGVIMPGARAMLDTLGRAKQLFPDTSRDMHGLSQSVHALADTTQGAILAGVVFAFQGGVHAVILQQIEQIKAKIETIPIIVTGGDSPMLKLDSMQLFVVPDLVLEGLRVLMECER